METHEEAQDVVNYYQQHPAALYGKPITFYLSKRLLVIEVNGVRLTHTTEPASNPPHTPLSSLCLRSALRRTSAPRTG